MTWTCFFFMGQLWIGSKWVAYNITESQSLKLFAGQLYVDDQTLPIEREEETTELFLRNCAGEAQIQLERAG